MKGRVSVREWKVEKVKDKSVSTLLYICMYKLYV